MCSNGIVVERHAAEGPQTFLVRQSGKHADARRRRYRWSNLRPQQQTGEPICAKSLSLSRWSKFYARCTVRQRTGLTEVCRTRLWMDCEHNKTRTTLPHDCATNADARRRRWSNLRPQQQTGEPVCAKSLSQALAMAKILCALHGQAANGPD